MNKTPYVCLRFLTAFLFLMLALSLCLVPAHAAHHLDVKDFEQFVPYWTTEGSWHSELQLRNNINGQDLTVSPSVRMADGAEIKLPAVTIKPQEVKTIDIGQAAHNSAGLMAP
jgi:hypothetical protein